jgi:hypothetical protein
MVSEHKVVLNLYDTFLVLGVILLGKK